MKYKLTILIAAIMAAASCASHEKTGPVEYRLLSGDDISVTVDTGGKAVITSTLLPGMEIIGEMEADDPTVCTVVAVNMIGNWPNGWTYCRYEASGKYRFIESGSAYWVKAIDPLELWEIEKGEIRYFDTYYRGDDGLHKARQRVDRMRELARFLQKDKEFAEVSGSLKKTTVFGQPFKAVQGAFLFPEYYDREKVSGVGLLDKGEAWDAAYTTREFPEQLQSLRDSGSLWRDYEEAPQMLLALYNLDFVSGKLLLKTQLHRR